MYIYPPLFSNAAARPAKVATKFAGDTDPEEEYQRWLEALTVGDTVNLESVDMLPEHDFQNGYRYRSGVIEVITNREFHIRPSGDTGIIKISRSDGQNERRNTRLVPVQSQHSSLDSQYPAQRKYQEWIRTLQAGQAISLQQSVQLAQLGPQWQTLYGYVFVDATVVSIGKSITIQLADGRQIMFDPVTGESREDTKYECWIVPHQTQAKSSVSQHPRRPDHPTYSQLWYGSN